MFSVLSKTLIMYFVLTLLMKILGKRQIGELEASDLVCTLLISEIAALPIADKNIPVIGALFPILLIIALEIFLSAIKNRSERLKKTIEGAPCYIIYKGRLIQEELRKNRISINELISEARIQGVADISEIYYAILEQSGKFSIFKNSDAQKLSRALIIDGRRNTEAMKELGISDFELSRRLRERGLKEEEVFLYSLNEADEVKVIRKEDP